MCKDTYIIAIVGTILITYQLSYLITFLSTNFSKNTATFFATVTVIANTTTNLPNISSYLFYLVAFQFSNAYAYQLLSYYILFVFSYYRTPLPLPIYLPISCVSKW